jgi:hypothetical protein
MLAGEDPPGIQLGPALATGGQCYDFFRDFHSKNVAIFLKNNVMAAIFSAIFANFPRKKGDVLENQCCDNHFSRFSRKFPR